MAQGVGIPGALAQLSGRVAGPSAASVATGAGVTSEPPPLGVSTGSQGPTALFPGPVVEGSAR